MVTGFRRYMALLLLVSVLLCLIQVLPGAAQSNTLPYVYTIDWSEDGSRLAVVTRESLTIYDGSLNVIAFQAFPSDLAFDVPDVALSPNGERIYVGRPKRDPRIVDTSALQLSCASNWIAAVCVNHAILDTATLETIVDFGEIFVYSSSAEWSQDGLSIAFRSDRATSIYSAVDGSLLRSFSPPPVIWAVGYEGGVEWSPNNLYFARAGGDLVFIMDASTGQIANQFQFEGETVLDVAWSPDSTRMAALTTADVALGTLGSVADPNSVNGARRNSLIIFDVTSEQIITTINEPFVSILRLVWSPDGTQIAGATGRPKVYIWDPNTGTLLDSYQTPPYLIENIDYSPYSGRLLVGFNTAASIAERIDPTFVPMSTFVQPELNGVIEFVAPAASPARLSSLLLNCVTDETVVASGISLIGMQRFAEFADWISQQSSAVIASGCSADLQAIALTLENELPTPTAISLVQQPTTVIENNSVMPSIRTG